MSRSVIIGMSLTASVGSSSLGAGGNIQETAAKGDQDQRSLPSFHLKSPDKRNGKHPQRDLNSEAGGFDGAPSNEL